MLFHVTATHTTEDCPGYNPDKMPAVIAAMENLEATAKELNIKVHFMVSGAPEHVSFLLLEADSPAAIARFAVQMPCRQDFKVTAVVKEQELLAMAKAMAGQS